MAVPIWVIIETHMTKSSHKLSCEAIIEADILRSRKHFYRVFQNIMYEDTRMNHVDFRKEDDEATLADQAIINREERLDEKLKQLTLECEAEKPEVFEE
jgi:hypothetical protein